MKSYPNEKPEYNEKKSFFRGVFSVFGTKTIVVGFEKKVLAGYEIHSKLSDIRTVNSKKKLFSKKSRNSKPHHPRYRMKDLNLKVFILFYLFKQNFIPTCNKIFRILNLVSTGHCQDTSRGKLKPLGFSRVLRFDIFSKKNWRFNRFLTFWSGSGLEAAPHKHSFSFELKLTHILLKFAYLLLNFKKLESTIISQPSVSASLKATPRSTAFWLCVQKAFSFVLESFHCVCTRSAESKPK